MTILQQVRWQCDYEFCDLVSPVLDPFMQILDRGEKTLDYMPPIGWAWMFTHDGYKHFCRDEHKRLWEVKQETD